MGWDADARKYFEIVKRSAERLKASGVEVYVFSCPYCSKTILGKTPAEVILNGARHLAKCIQRR